MLTAMQPDKEKLIFAFTYRAALGCEETEQQGWDVYDLQSEYSRMAALSGSHWRVSEANVGFGVCDSYPELVVVPLEIDDDVPK